MEHKVASINHYSLKWSEGSSKHPLLKRKSPTNNIVSQDLKLEKSVEFLSSGKPLTFFQVPAFEILISLRVDARTQRSVASILVKASG